jgi:hypothetical protein
MNARLSLVEGVAEAVWGAVQVELAWGEESVGALGGLVLSWALVVLLGSWIVVDSWNVVVLLALGWDGSGGWGGMLVVVVVLGWARDWS